MAIAKKQVRVTQKSLDAVRKSPAEPREPSSIDFDDYNVSLTHHLSFYNSEFDAKTKKAWVVGYYADFDKAKANILQGVNHQYFNTFGALVRMHQNGVIFRDSIHVRLDGLYSEISKKTPDTIPQEKETLLGPKERFQEAILGEFEGVYDLVCVSGKTNLGMGNFIVTYKPTQATIEKIKDNIIRKISGLRDVQSNKENLTAYGITKKRCADLIDMLDTTLREIGALNQPKPRKVKAISVQKMVSKVKYLKRDPLTEIESIDPSVVLGKQEILCYNNKTKKVIIFVALDGGFGFTGTTLCNVDEAKSRQKTLRDPKNQLVSLVQLSKRGFIKAFDMVKSIETTPTTRFSDETLICKLL